MDRFGNRTPADWLRRSVPRRRPPTNQRQRKRIQFEQRRPPPRDRRSAVDDLIKTKQKKRIPGFDRNICGTNDVASDENECAVDGFDRKCKRREIDMLIDMQIDMQIRADGGTCR